MSSGSTIARGSVLITTDADLLHKGMSDAGKDVDKFGKSAGKKGGHGFGGGFAMGLKGALPLMAGMLAFDGVKHAAEAFSELTEEMDKTSKLSESLDFPTERLVGWQHAAELSGVSNDDLTIAFQKLRKTTEGPLEESLLKIADKFEKAEDAGDKARILVDAFGKSGQKLAPMFKDGAKGIEEMVQEAKDLGITFDAKTGQQIEAANDAITKVKSAFKGLGKQFLIFIAPMVEGVANFVTKTVKLLRPTIDWMLRGFRTLEKIGAGMWEAIEKAAQDANQWITQTFSGMFDFMGEMPTIEEVVVGVFRAIGVSAAMAWDVIKLGAGVAAMAASGVIGAFGSVLDGWTAIMSLAKELPEELRPAGIDKHIKDSEELAAKIKGIGEGLGKWGEDAVTGFGKSAEDFNKWLDATLAKTKAVKDEVKKPGELKGDDLKFSDAVLKGTKEAYSMVVKNQFGDLMGEGTDKKQLKEQKKINKGVNKVADGVGKINKKLEDIDEF